MVQRIFQDSAVLPKQAKSATFYMLKYMTKDPIATASALSIIIEAAQKQHIPSLADDAGTPSRNAKVLCIQYHANAIHFDVLLCNVLGHFTISLFCAETR